MSSLKRGKMVMCMSLTAGLAMLSACGGEGNASAFPTPSPSSTPRPPGPVVGVTQTFIASFKSPWAMTFIPDGRLLVTDNEARSLSIVTPEGLVKTVSGLPVSGGIYDVAISPLYATGRVIYFTFAEPSPPGTPRDGPYAYPDYLADPKIFSGVLALATARIDESGGVPVLVDFKVIWRQTPQIVSGGEFGGRIAFSPDRKYVFVSSGDRAVYPPAQALDNTLGKIIRLNLDGSIPTDNPFVGTAGALGEIWSLGHRNPYGLAFAPDGRLWEHEHGPKGGDEFNLITRSANYGWPSVSYGAGYDDTPMTRPVAGDGFTPSPLYWTPAVAPAGMIFYSGSIFADWRGDVLMTGLVSKALIRVRIEGDTAREVQRIDLGGRAREIEQSPDGSLWVLIDSPDGKLVKLIPIL